MRSDTPSTIDIDALQQTFRGAIILPGDDAYAKASHTHNLVYTRRPAMVVRPLDADDVSAAVRFAAATGIPLAVRGGGHSSSDFGLMDGAMTIDLSAMNAVTIDPEARIGTAQGGTTAGAYMKAAMAHNLMTPFGDSPTVGVGGITTGGGVGWFTRKYGMTIDSLLAVDMVLADGRQVHASETEHPDLFWAIRGGGGNFGIVTRFVFRLYPLGDVLGGTLYLPASKEIVRRVIELCRAAPEELNVITTIMVVPPLPEMPAQFHNKLAVMLMPVWCGDLVEGERALAPFRALSDVKHDDIRRRSIIDIYENNVGPDAYAMVVRVMMARDLDDAAFDAFYDYTSEENPDPSAMRHFRVVGGAMARVPANATAFAHRDSELILTIGNVFFDPAQYAEKVAAADKAFAAMRHAAAGTYINFMEAEGNTRIHDAYPDATYRRLAEIKRRYDPHNLFRHNQNIIPAPASAA